MTHAQSFSQSRFEHQTEQEEERIRSCHQPLAYSGSCFHSDVSWEVYRCDACRVMVWTVGGSVHWWNFEAPIREPAQA